MINLTIIHQQTTWNNGKDIW